MGFGTYEQMAAEDREARLALDGHILLYAPIYTLLDTLLCRDLEAVRFACKRRGLRRELVTRSV